MKKYQQNLLMRILLLSLILVFIVVSIIGCTESLKDDANIPDDDPVPTPVEPADPIPVEPGEIIETDYVTISDMTFYFDDDYQVGTFANGDYWVLGPVTIDRITPDYDGYNYGWEVNPVVEGGAGFQDGCYDDKFDPSLVPDLPYTAERSLSIVKTTPYTESPLNRPCIKTAAVLTVVDEIPLQNGAAVFRPPYVGDEKPYYYVSDVRTDLLPSYEPVDNMPSLESIEESFSKLWLDHKPYRFGRALHPYDHMHNYWPDNTYKVNATVLRLMIDEPIEEKKQALINFINYGLDHIYMMDLGQTWFGGGHHCGHRIAPAFAAVMLGVDESKAFMRNAEFFHDKMFFHEGENTDGLVLWGEPTSEDKYWGYYDGTGGDKEARDPYGYVDGPTDYQGITAPAHVGQLLASHLMPELKEAWDMEVWSKMENYTDRWVLHGRWTLPDPAAPFDGNPENYEITYGTDKETGQLITGNGRFPDDHGTLRNSRYPGDFVMAMWNTYRSSIQGAEKKPPFTTIIRPYDAREVSDVVEIQATAFGIHGIESVQFKVDGSSIGTVTAPVEETSTTYQLSWDTHSYSNGNYELTVIATDGRGNTYESMVVDVTVDN
ncbi:MAG: Ig-like domain-containing protein [Halanaerobiales bacterium]